MDEITRILQAAKHGDQVASDKLLPIAYEELRQMARQQMANERQGHTLQPTALVHEAFIRLAGPNGEDMDWSNRRHFFAAAAQAMRRILIESARRKQASKRGRNPDRVTYEESMLETTVPNEEILAVDEALKILEAEDPALAQVVMLRYFAGLSVAETASALGVSPSKIDRQWRCAKAWLYREISEMQ